MSLIKKKKQTPKKQEVQVLNPYMNRDTRTGKQNPESGEVENIINKFMQKKNGKCKESGLNIPFRNTDKWDKDCIFKKQSNNKHKQLPVVRKVKEQDRRGRHK